MRLWLDHPAVARIPCDDCKKYVYDMETGERQTYQWGSPDNVVDQIRPGKPPCQCGWVCPKGSPNQERRHVLTKRNHRLFDAFLQHKFTGQTPSDALQRWLFTKLGQLYSRWERDQLAATLAALFSGR